MKPNNKPRTVNKASDALVAVKRRYVSEMEKIQARVTELNQLNADAENALVAAIVEESKQSSAKAKPLAPVE